MDIALKYSTVHFALMHITTVIVFCQFLLQNENRGVERCLM
jgi:hypothetical protein